MMMLWIMVYVAGTLGGTIGPLPYGMDECQHRAAEETTAMRRHVFPASHVTFVCEWHARRPELPTDKGGSP